MSDFIPRPAHENVDDSAIHVQDLFHGFYDETKRRQKIVLNDIDLLVSPGEFVSLVGPSGCGKSTALKLFTGQELVQKATKFQVLKGPSRLPDKTRGVVFQKYGLAPHLTVLGNIMLGLQFQASIVQSWSPKWKKAAKDIARAYLDEMRLSDAGNKYPGELSGGMQQRVAIAQALITIDMFGMPDLLCMDEPYGALDASTREDLQIFILKLWEKYKKTIIFVTHDLDEALFLGTRVVVLSQYWTSDLPPEQQEGARIVVDLPLERHALSTEVKNTPQFKELGKYILDRGFNPKQRLHVREHNADIRHPNSFSTISPEMCRSCQPDKDGQLMCAIPTAPVPPGTPKA